jgi:hypothetical protein
MGPGFSRHPTGSTPTAGLEIIWQFNNLIFLVFKQYQFEWLFQFFTKINCTFCSP